ncbi:MAG: ABC transporter permease [Anaerolineae bacterium]|nr:ABC transporter permease [Anaerolineae bacterium]
MRKLWKIAYRDLTRNRRRSLLTLVAVALGVAMLVTLTGLYAGAIGDSIENNIRLQTGHLQLRDDSYDEDKVSLAWQDLLDNSEELAEQVRGLDGVEAASPVLWASGIVSTREESVGVRVFGIDPLSDLHKRVRDGLVAGEYLQPDDRSGLLLGRRLAESMEISVGDQVNLLVNTSNQQADEAMFTVRGLYQTGVPTYDDITILLPLSKAQSFTGTEGRASAIVALLGNRERADAIAQTLSAPGYNVLTWTDMNQVILQAIETSMGITYLMYLIVLAVVAVVIANTLLMSVFERVREMGILAALGMKGRQIMAMFMLEAGTLGLVGVMAGVLLGSLGVLYLATVGLHIGDMATVATAEVAYGEVVHGQFDPGATLGLSLGAMVIILLASLYPAWFAARLEPIDALRAQ